MSDDAAGNDEDYLQCFIKNWLDLLDELDNLSIFDKSSDLTSEEPKTTQKELTIWR